MQAVEEMQAKHRAEVKELESSMAKTIMEMEEKHNKVGQ
jgi:hypothetical protein